MAYCCVPLCSSNVKKKPPGVSFHEIPADWELREKWIQAIRRDNWTPNTTSNYSKVCSKHFQATDFVEGKLRRLTKGTIPSVFEDYPLHLQPTRVKERSISSIKKRAMCSDSALEGCTPQKIRKRSDGPQSAQHVVPLPASPSSSTADEEPVTERTELTAANVMQHGHSPQDTAMETVPEDCTAPSSTDVDAANVAQHEDQSPQDTDMETVPEECTAPSSSDVDETGRKSTELTAADVAQHGQSPQDTVTMQDGRAPPIIRNGDEALSEPIKLTAANLMQRESQSPDNVEESTVPEDHISQNNIEAPLARDQETQADIRKTWSLLASEKTKWKRKERDMRKQIERLKRTVDSYKKELQKLRDDGHVADFTYIKERADEKHQPAIFLLEQVSNFRRQKPSWSEDTLRHSIVLRHLSTKMYEHLRSEGLLKLPSRNTLQNYLGTTSGETGFNSLIEERLKAELEHLPASQSRVCSLIADEMRIKQRLQYNKQQDSFVGHTDMGFADDPNTEPSLANSLLCFVLNGLSTSFRIPVSYFFTKGLNGSQLSKLLLFVIEKVEKTGFRVLRLVTDNHKTNVSAMKILCGGILTYRIQHPHDPERLLFLSFDYCHIIKNVRSQFLAHDIGKDGEISSSHLKKIYEMQKDWIVKPVRFLSRKHVYPSNIEKMNVSRAIDVLSPDVTSTLRYLKDQAGHSSNTSFASSGPTITFMESMYRWFLLHDTSNKSQHERQRFPDVRHYDDPQDSRLEWLETAFPLYLEDLKTRANTPRQFLSKETYEALLLTTYSTVSCVRHLLTKEHYLFVLTRKFSSDPIESLFGTLRRSVGCNDQLDVRSTLSGLEKMLKTGIATASRASNVAHSGDTEPHLQGLRHVQPRASKELKLELSRDAKCVLGRLKVSEVRQRLPTLELSATAYVRGYIARVVSEHMECDSCITVTTKPVCNQPVMQFIRNQDRGGLIYPSDQLVYVLDTLKELVRVVLKEHPRLEQPLAELLKVAVPAVAFSPLLRCGASEDEAHRKRFAELVCRRFMSPLLVNHAFKVTDKYDVYKAFAKKPLSRKYVKL
uniref:Putative transposase protein n=1 Tax=Ixodes ricinus TaxID=34613 RepID=A0A147BC10_IXORI